MDDAQDTVSSTDTLTSATTDPFSADSTAQQSDLETLLAMSQLMSSSGLFGDTSSTSSLFGDTTTSSSLFGDSSLLTSMLLGSDLSASSSLLSGDLSLYSSLLGGDYSSLLSGSTNTSLLSSLLGLDGLLAGTTSADSAAQLYSDVSALTGSGASPSELGLTKVSETADFSGAEPYMGIVKEMAVKYNLPEDLILAVMKVESSFINAQTSSAGAQGLMQLMPGTAEYLGVTDVMDPAQNIEGGAKYLREMLDQFNGDIRLALAAYNTGPGNVGKSGAESSFSSEYLNISEGVRGYVDKVLGYAGYEVSA